MIVTNHKVLIIFVLPYSDISGYIATHWGKQDADTSLHRSDWTFATCRYRSIQPVDNEIQMWFTEYFYMISFVRSAVIFTTIQPDNQMISCKIYLYCQIYIVECPT